MKRISSFFPVGITSLIYLLSAKLAHADLCPVGNFAPLCNLRLDNASSITGSIVTILLVFGVIVAIIFMIIGGIRWTMSGGDKGKLDQARHTITGAIVGIIIAFSAYFVLNVITFLFTGSSVLNFNIPTIVP